METYIYIKWRLILYNIIWFVLAISKVSRFTNTSTLRYLQDVKYEEGEATSYSRGDLYQPVTESQAQVNGSPQSCKPLQPKPYLVTETPVVVNFR